MAYDNTGGAVIISLLANADLSSYQYYFVKLDANGKAGVCAAVTDIPSGILHNKPDASGKAATVMVMGVSKVNADAAINEGVLVGSAADGQVGGKVAVSNTTEYICGQMLTATATSGDIGTAVINCANPARAQ